MTTLDKIILIVKILGVIVLKGLLIILNPLAWVQYKRDCKIMK